MAAKHLSGNIAKKGNLGDNPIPWLLPILLILGALFIYPIIDVIRLSFTNSKIGSADAIYTFHSYKSLFLDPEFPAIIKTTLIFVFFSVAFQTLLGFAIALSVDKGEKLKLRGTVFVRTVSLISMVIPGVVIGIIWRLMFDESPSGVINFFFTNIGLGPIRFLTDPNSALVGVTVANIWRGTAQSMIMLYAGIKTVPNDIMEASKVDGANSWVRLCKMIIPTMMPVIMVNIILNLINTFNTFDMVMSLTGGGPGRSTEVLALNVYSQIFHHLNLGKGAATAVVLVGINTIMAIVYFQMLKRQEK